MKFGEVAALLDQFDRRVNVYTDYDDHFILIDVDSKFARDIQDFEVTEISIVGRILTLRLKGASV